MFRKSKLYVSLFIAITVLFSSSVSAFAATESSLGKAKSISPSTVITSDNIYDVLQYVGIDSKYYTKSDTVDSSANVATVKDLQEAIAQAKAEIAKDSKSSTYRSMVTLPQKVIINSPTPETVTLKYRSDHSSYDLNYSCTATFQMSNGKFLSARNPRVTLFDMDGKTNHKIKSKSLYATVTDSGSTVQLEANLVISFNYKLPGGGIEIGSEPISETVYWYPSDV